MGRIFFNGWEGLLRTLIIGVLAYATLIIILRISGKRTLSKLNAFDLVVTVALGSTLATVLLNQSVALAEGAVAFAVLTSLQFLVTWSCVRSQTVRNFVKSEPTLLVYRGEMLEDAMRRERITRDELESAIRSARLHDFSEVDAIVLETDGSLSVVARWHDRPQPNVAGVKTPPAG
jgi:uncharacterized membrane protein YcaP (DUF421 family)